MTYFVWKPATPDNIEAMADISVEHYNAKSVTIMSVSKPLLMRNLFEVMSLPPEANQIVKCAFDENDKIIGWHWYGINNIHWSTDQMVTPFLVIVDPTLSDVKRVRMVEEMMTEWEEFGRQTECVGIASNSIVDTNDSAYMKMHVAAGYELIGSSAFKKL